MKAKMKRLIPVTLLIIVLGYLFLTPVGALRLAVASTGHPIKAVSLQISDEPYDGFIENNQEMYTLIDPPYEKATGGYLENWVVTRYFIFYLGEYYGWG